MYLNSLISFFVGILFGFAILALIYSVLVVSSIKSKKYVVKTKNDEVTDEEIKEALNPSDYNMIVTPKEIDDLIENMKDVVARGINYAV